MNKEALLIVDYQKDFWEKDWSLYVKGWELLVPEMNRLIAETKERSWIVIASRDWHPANHCSFKIWPAHCVENTRWAEYVDWLDIRAIEHEVRKWFRSDKDSYSAFGWYEFRWEYALRSLHDLLRDYEIRLLRIAWLVTDYCIKATAIDWIDHGFEVEVIGNAVKAVDINPEDWENAIKEMKDRWVRII